ncbi:MAG TPA: head GIN domain-containing protein [Kofleriaceae bacterium]
MKIHALVVLAGCSWTGVQGSGNAKSEVRNVPAFSAVEVAGSFDAEIAVGPESHVEITGDDNIVPLVTSDVHGDRLEIGTRKNVRPSVRLVARITVPRLTGIRLTGSGDIAAHGVQADHLRVILSGSGTIRADGTAHEAEIDVTGSGTVALDKLAAERVRVSVSGSGDVAVAASKALDVSITGSGDVTYRGDPELKKQISGSGNVTRR